jgi:ATP/maltotriose-dependent transcriptional regulator MalT
MGGYLDPSPNWPAEPLTRREGEILRLLATDLSNQQIADQLCLSLSSVKWFSWQIYQKLGIKNRRQALTRARSLGLLDDHPVKDAFLHNLPSQLTSFIGREKEISHLCSLLTTYRLVTLAGPGGAGKTRLALQVGGLLSGIFPDGAWLVDLAPLSEPGLIPQTIAAALHLTLSVEHSPGTSLLNGLRN